MLRKRFRINLTRQASSIRRRRGVFLAEESPLLIRLLCDPPDSTPYRKSQVRKAQGQDAFEITGSAVEPGKRSSESSVRRVPKTIRSACRSSITSRIHVAGAPAGDHTHLIVIVSIVAQPVSLAEIASSASRIVPCASPKFCPALKSTAHTFLSRGICYDLCSCSATWDYGGSADALPAIASKPAPRKSRSPRGIVL